jgi:hypothetical protein
MLIVMYANLPACHSFSCSVEIRIVDSMGSSGPVKASRATSTSRIGRRIIRVLAAEAKKGGGESVYFAAKSCNPGNYFPGITCCFS